jgi:hypothetical protein
VHYRVEFSLTREDEVDLHFGQRGPHQDYWEVMAEVRVMVENALIKAQRNRRPYVLFIHGWSTSRPGRTTARSEVRQFMHSPAATPYIERNGCIQDEAVFLAKVRRHEGGLSTPDRGAAADVRAPAEIDREAT